MVGENKIGPDNPSGDHCAMMPYWHQAQTILDGTAAMRAAGEKYLPKFPMEDKEDYEYRRKNAKFTNIFRDINENLASKPFAKELTVKDGTAGEALKALIDDIDGAGNHLRVFAYDVFFNGIAKCLDYIFVDNIKVPAGATVAVEKALGARPYWVRYSAESVVGTPEMVIIDGTEQCVHFRVLEPTVVRDGWKETTKERVREFNRPKTIEIDADGGAPRTIYGQPVWILWEKQQRENSAEYDWVAIDTGFLAIPVIPLVPFVTGRRKGRSWRFNPPMQDASDVQIKHYQQETNLECAKELSCFAMLKGEGLAPAIGKDGKPERVPRGPGAVLYAPMDNQGNHGTWDTLEPSAESMKFCAADLKETENRMRELGRQPLTAQTGNLTVITTAFAAQKGNSACQAWAFNLKDALELALKYTCMWLQDTASKPEVEVYTDFGIDLKDGASMERLIKMRARNDLDRRTLLNESKRRGDLAADVDVDEVAKALREEAPDPDGEDDLDAAGGAKPPANDDGPPEPLKEAA